MRWMLVIFSFVLGITFGLRWTSKTEFVEIENVELENALSEIEPFFLEIDKQQNEIDRLFASTKPADNESVGLLANSIQADLKRSEQLLEDILGPSNKSKLRENLEAEFPPENYSAQEYKPTFTELFMVRLAEESIQDGEASEDEYRSAYELFRSSPFVVNSYTQWLLRRGRFSEAQSVWESQTQKHGDVSSYLTERALSRISRASTQEEKQDIAYALVNEQSAWADLLYKKTRREFVDSMIGRIADFE